MADEALNNIEPAPKLHFSVTLSENNTVSFQEVDGLESATGTIESRYDSSPISKPIKIPGIERSGNVLVRKGIFVNDSSFWDWYNEIKMNTIARRTILISLLDEQGNVKMTWTLNNAWPAKITGTALESEGNEIAVESVEIAYETLTITGH